MFLAVLSCSPLLYAEIQYPNISAARVQLQYCSEWPVCSPAVLQLGCVLLAGRKHMVQQETMVRMCAEACTVVGMSYIVSA